MTVRLNEFKLARMKAGLTQKTLAERLKCSESLIAKWETERSRPKGEKLAKIADILQCKAEELF